MRTLLLFRGAPGCGKSTYIAEHGLKNYTLCADDIRMLCQSPQQTIDGSVQIGCDNERVVWDTLFKILEIRMQKGEFTVIDATNSKAIEMNRYKKLADDYRYRIFCVDMTDLPIEECKKRNAERIPLKRVPEEAIDKMYARFKTQKIPSGIVVIKPDELDKIWLHKIDLSQYRKVVHIGDIHGCNTVLQEYLKDGIQDDIFYIFVGDYLDRGIENVDVLNYLLKIKDKKNVFMLTGNHERWISCYAHDKKSSSREFELVTKLQLEEAKIDKKELRQFCRKFGQCAWYTYGDKEIFVSHAGVATLPENPTLLATDQMIRGVGKYEDFETVADSWMRTTGENQYQIYGHRNTKNLPIKIRDRVFNLEGRVEFGGQLRVVELDNDGFHEIEVQNTVFKPKEEFDAQNAINSSDVATLVLAMRNSKWIQEKNFGNISSFNFSKKAFEKNIWDNLTIHARGLFIDTEMMRVAARSFDKAFYVGQGDCPDFDQLQDKLQFPVTAYVKENGFLGLISYDERLDTFLITTKSSIGGPFAEWLKDMFFNKTTEDSREKIKQFLKENNVTMLFECVDMEHDPHVIDYPESNLYLLDVVANNIKFDHVSYETLSNIAERFGLAVKTKAYELATWQEFYDWYWMVQQPGYEFDGHVIEGFVVEDSQNYMIKIKTDYYNFWKFMRGIAAETIRKGYIDRTGVLTTEEANLFYGFVRKLYTETEDRDSIPRDIVTLRRMFFQDIGVK